MNNNIPDGWKETTLGEVSKKISYGYTQSSSDKDIGPKFLRISDIQEDFIDWDKVPYCKITEKDYIKYKLEIGDIVVARTGNSTGATATIKTTNNAVFASYLICFKIDPQKANYLFIDFLLRSKFWEGFVNTVKSGSAQGGANARNFAEFPMLLPPLPEQKAIAEVLSSFDNKIELLREQNKTLEAIAQTIFNEWFVRFNFPDENGKPYQASGGKMIDSQLGTIPEGWRVGKLGEILELNYGKALKEEDRIAGAYPVYGSSGKVGAHNVFLVEGPGIVVGRKGTIGTITWADENFYPIDTVFFVVDKIGIDKLIFHYQLLKTIDFNKLGSDSAVPGLNRHSVHAISTIIPEIVTILRFCVATDPITNKIQNNNSQIQTLSTLRDALLPKLMNGGIRVKEVVQYED